jgi:hypothetical protein
VLGAVAAVLDGCASALDVESGFLREVGTTAARAVVLVHERGAPSQRTFLAC